MKNILYRFFMLYFLTLICSSIVFSQNKIDATYFNILEKDILKDKADLLTNLDTLSKIVLDEDSFYKLRIEAIQLINQMQIDEAKEFLFKNINLYMYDESFCDRVHFYYNIPVFSAFSSKNIAEFNLYNQLFDSSILSECYHKFQLNQFYGLLRKKYGKELGKQIVQMYLPKANSACMKSNLEGILKQFDQH